MKAPLSPRGSTPLPGSLNLRYSPDSSAQIIGTIPRLATVKLLVEGNEWSYVGVTASMAMS